MVTRKATVRDVDPIRKLINGWAEQGCMLPRSLNELYENIRDFFVCEEQGKIIACAALHIAWEDLAEVKSLAVREQSVRSGLGTKLVGVCLAEAREIGVKRVFALTYEVKFFEKNGFNVISRSDLPHKIWNECIRCPKFPDCDATAMIYDIAKGETS